MDQLKRAETIEDRIALWLNDDTQVQLSDQERKIYERADFAETLLRGADTDAKIIERLVKKFGVSERTARNDLHRARAIFSPIAKINKDYYRWWLYQQQLKIYNKAVETNQLKVAEALLKQMHATLGLDKTEDAGIDPARLGNNSYYLIVGNANNEALKINLDNIDLLHTAQVEKIQEAVNQDFIEMESKMLKDELRDK